MKIGSALNRFVCSALALLCASAGFSQATGILHTSGTQIVDPLGTAVQLKGVNLGCWLYVEPWMWGTFYFGNFEDGQGEVDKLGNYLSANLTPTQVSQFWSTYRSNYVQAADIQRIKNFGWNCVRVPMDFRLFIDPSTGNLITSNYVYLDNLLSWCNTSGVYAILDMHSVPGSPYYNYTNNIFTSAANQALLTKVWVSLAKRYATNPAVAGYDLMNEPVANGDPRLRTVQVNLTSAIRGVDTKHIIFAEGDWYDSQLDILGAPWDSNMAFSDHNYGSTLPNNLPHDQSLATTYNIPLWMGEFGYNSNNWIAQQEQLLNAHNTVNGKKIQSNWSLWSFKANAIWSPMKFGAYGPFQTVLNYLNNGGTAPTSTQIYNGLIDLANATYYTRNTTNLDVTDATIRSTFLTATRPWTALTIPGTIGAVQYDFGPEGLAYHSTVSSNTGGMGSGFQNWNNGWTYRNDGVDITSWVSAGVPQYAVGWIAAGEWNQYTTAVTPGNYSVVVKYAGTGGTMHVTVNGSNVTGSIVLPASPNSGTSYTTFTVPNVTLVGYGALPVRFNFDAPGFNLQSVTFNPVTSTIPTGKALTILAESNSEYVVNTGSGLVASEAKAGSVGTADQFKLLPISGNTVIIQSVSSGNFVTAGSGTSAPLSATAKLSSLAARFSYVDAGSGSFYLFCQTNSQYVSADQFLGTPPPLAADRSVPQGWETYKYTLVP